MSYDHLVPGTAESGWLAAGLDALPTVGAVHGRLVVVAAHPDDETLGAGGLIAASARLGAEIDVVVASDGEASHPSSPTRTPADLAGTRRVEVCAAVARLVPHATLHQLSLPDGALAGHVDAVAECVARIVDSSPVDGGGSADGGGPARIVSPWRDDRHPDHEACAQAAARVASAAADVEHWQYPIWWWHWGDPAAPLPSRLHRFDLDAPERTAKRAAMGEHVSQHAALSLQVGDEPILPPNILAHFERSYECFVLPAPAARPAYFDALYADSPDPWGLGDRFYEQRKRDLVLASLPRPRFTRVFEPGCATGLLSARLAERADALVAWDVSPVAVRQAEGQLDGVAGAQVQQGRIPDEWPDGVFDLIVLSEVAYYCDDLDRLVRRVLDSLAPDGIVLGCHWVREAHDHPLTAADVHGALDEVLIGLVRHAEDDFRLDVWARDGRSVAVREGIA